MPIDLPQNPRILVTRTDRIGDLVLTTPVFKALREKFPKAWIAAIVFLEHREIVQGNPYLDEVILYDKKGGERGLWGQLLFAGRLRQKRFDLVIHCHGTNRMHLAGWLAGIPVRIGYARRAPWALTYVHPYNKKEGQKRETEYLFELLEPLGIPPPQKIETFFPVTERAVSSFGNYRMHHSIPEDRPWIVLSPSASDKTKRWPAEKFGALAERIYDTCPCVFLAVGTRHDREIIERVRQNARVPVYDLSGRMTLGMLGALLKRALLLVSNDSGPVHIASAVGTPVVSIFGRHEPGLASRRWQPVGEKTRVVAKDVTGIPEAERKFTYIDEITVDQVFQAAMQLIRAGIPGLDLEIRKKHPEKIIPSSPLPVPGLRVPSPKSRTPKFRRVLIVHPYGIGDLLFITPVLRALRLMPTVETVDLLLGSRTREVVEHNPHINEIFVMDKDRLRRQTRQQNFREHFELGRKLRGKDYDLLLDYSLRRENAFCGRFLLGIPQCAGFAYKKRAIFHTLRYPLQEGFQGRHGVDYYCDLAEQAGIPVEDRFLEYYFPRDISALETQAMNKLGGLPAPFLTVSPGGGDSWGKEAAFKRWPVKYFAELIRKLRPRLKIQGICILGSASEKALCEELKNLVEIPAAVLAGETSLAATAMLLKKSVFFMGNDGGLVHLARALEVPLMGFYGPVPPEVYGPYPPSPHALAVYKKDLACRPCYAKFRFNSACPTIECLRDLTPDEVMKSLEGQSLF